MAITDEQLLLAAANEPLINYVIDRWFPGYARPKWKAAAWDFGRHILELAAAKFDPTRGVKFGTYAVARLRVDFRAFRRHLRQRRRGLRRHAASLRVPTAAECVAARDAAIDVRAAIASLPVELRGVIEEWVEADFNRAVASKRRGCSSDSFKTVLDEATWRLAGKLLGYREPFNPQTEIER